MPAKNTCLQTVQPSSSLANLAQHNFDYFPGCYWAIIGVVCGLFALLLANIRVDNL